MMIFVDTLIFFINCRILINSRQLLNIVSIIPRRWWSIHYLALRFLDLLLVKFINLNASIISIIVLEAITSVIIRLCHDRLECSARNFRVL